MDEGIQAYMGPIWLGVKAFPGPAQNSSHKFVWAVTWDQSVQELYMTVIASVLTSEVIPISPPPVMTPLTSLNGVLFGLVVDQRRYPSD